MTTRVFVFLPADPGEALVWAAPHADGARTAWGRIGGEDGEDARPPRADELIAVAPGADVALYHAKLPARTEAQARAAAPFAIEDDLADSIEDVHVALGPKPAPDTDRTMAVTRREKMEEWTAALAEAGLPAQVLAPDYALLPYDAEEAVIVEFDGRVLVRAHGAGFSIDQELADMLVPAALRDAGAARAEIWSDHPQAVLGLNTDPDIALKTQPAPANEAFVHLLNAGVHRAAPINLLQGAYAPRGRAMAEFGLRRWRPAAILTGLLIAGWTALQGAQAVSYGRQADQLERRTEALFRQAFPDVTRIVDPGAQLRARLADVEPTSASAFLDLSGVLFASLRTVPAVQLDTMRFDGDAASITATIVYDAYADIEGLRRAVEQGGARFEEGGSRRLGERFSGEITVSWS